MNILYRPEFIRGFGTYKLRAERLMTALEQALNVKDIGRLIPRRCTKMNGRLGKSCVIIPSLAANFVLPPKCCRRITPPTGLWLVAQSSGIEC